MDRFPIYSFFSERVRDSHKVQNSEKKVIIYGRQEITIDNDFFPESQPWPELDKA
jgi:hypothetical protein